MFIFALDLEHMEGSIPYTEVGRRLAKEGVLSVILDPPCHGPDQKPGEPPQLQGWRSRIEKGDNTIAEFTKRVSAVVDHLVATKMTDEKHIAACGTSRGGFLALHAAAAEPRISAAAAFSPVTDLLALREFRGLENHPLVLSLDVAQLAPKLAEKQVWISIGNDDERVDTDASITAARAIVREKSKKPGDKSPVTPVELIVGPSVGHAIVPHAHARAASWLFGPLLGLTPRVE
ncbi:MAG: prolyl oligopeptidase family serine peptidase [Planctomycetota bacterium]